MIVVKAAVAVTGLLLAAGLALHMADGGDGLSATLLAAGLIVLMMTPAVRVLFAVAEWVRARDWQFVLVTLIVLVELSVTLWLAANRM